MERGLPAEHADGRRWGKWLLQEQTEETEVFLRYLRSLMFNLFRKCGPRRVGEAQQVTRETQGMNVAQQGPSVGGGRELGAG